MNLLDIFDSNVRKYGNKDFLRYNNQSESYTEVYEKSLQVASFLHKNGIKPDDKVALFCYNTPSFIWFLFGAWRLGATVVPINHKLKSAELDYILRDSDTKLLLFDAALVDIVQEVTFSIPMVSTQGKVSDFFEIDTTLKDYMPLPLSDSFPLTHDSPAQILYTSGTTGAPKGCVMPHFSVYMAAQVAATTLGLSRDERLLLAMPIWHSSPLNNWFGATLYLGGTVVLLREYSPLQMLETIEREKITLYFGAPISYILPLRTVPNFGNYDLSSVRRWAYGGGPISEDISRKISLAYRSNNFYQVFGMTETGPTGIVLYPEEQLHKAGSIGKYALPSVSIKVVDEQGNEVPNGSIGEIWIKAFSCMAGYYKNPQASQDAFTDDGWYITGDIARKDKDGYLYIVDRKKDIINTGGENVYSKQVEDALLLHPDIVDAAVIGTPHHEWGETVTAILVTNKIDPISPDKIATFLGKHLPTYRIPKIYHFTDALPRTPSGKVQKFVIKEQFIAKMFTNGSMPKTDVGTR
ncbi:class I adenylate-forming enzyme family protein [Sphingobacterium psychroaquaticum]|uniref:Feruloyl-CoA synthase n=1 Tax=Sphingobacterium psychroaquaticum TaxID=561061 RepID=A0A1X7KQ24_9SPHI|nr:AMP-binding protein [Sphingobacterium psychroaquaticum]QBQ40503.1 long-chain fatty acid--CoA ligase [Sphingobacterium psychroaquaticum]SMG42823.1 feruloyl-CoA synthase [Sphingobacterium psychroaquaticum]